MSRSLKFDFRLFPCRACEAKDGEIGRLSERIRWFQEQLDLQNRRLVEIADPRANERVVQAERLLRKPPNSPPRAAPSAAPLLPGTEPGPQPERAWEVDEEEP